MAFNTITLKGGVVTEEALASGTVTPGMLVEPTSATALTYKAHATAGGTAARIFAIEDESQGNGITDDYATGSIMQVAHFLPGDEVYALLADGETAVKGSKLESAGTGRLRVIDTDPSAGTIGVQSVVAWAMEAVDMSGSSAADPSGRIRVKVM